MKRAMILLAIFLLAEASTGRACEGDELAMSTFATIAVDRCLAGNVTLGFERNVRHGVTHRQFVTVSHEDGRKLYEALKRVYEKH